MRHLSFIIVGLLFCTSVASAQEPPTAKSETLELIETPDSSTNAYIRVFQDKRMEDVMMEKRIVNKNAIVQVYRVQVFSSNVQREAKTNAYNIERQIREKFPEHDVYVSYSSPFWKVRVGDFFTMGDARRFQAELIKMFPALKNDTYPVMEQINASQIR
ncbi:MAG: SPOR domain-containing protein [Prevotellaceae bacterium]|jgi:hypothetical protein|nr:SPOR domain-containing protein [Prevotellaceae bacterium]